MDVNRVDKVDGDQVDEIDKVSKLGGGHVDEGMEWRVAKWMRWIQ